MTDHDTLLIAVLADPDNDLPRLQFADYWERNGDEDRAAFIRVQIELAKLPVERLTRQLRLMTGYSEVLGERIAAFTPTGVPNG